MLQLESRKCRQPGRYACALVLTASLASGLAARAEDVRGTENAAQPPMNMNEPMPIKMKKEGMKTGNVKKAAQKREREMKATLQKESESMPRGSAKQ